MTDQNGLQWRHTACPLCGTDDPELRVIDHLQHHGEWLDFRICRCRSCGLDYVTERASAPSLGNVQGGAARRDASTANLPLYEAGMRALAREGMAPGARILDVGCARGDFLAYASARDFDSTGLDLNPVLADEARARGFSVHTGDVRTVRLPAPPDAITMWDVIEHVDDPVEVLAACAETLRPGGLLLVHTGNARFQIPKARALNAVAPTRGPYLIPQQHLTHWDPLTMKKGLAKAGLEPRRVFFAGTLHYRQAWKRAAMATINLIGRAPDTVGLGLYTSSMAAIGRRPGD